MFTVVVPDNLSVQGNLGMDHEAIYEMVDAIKDAIDTLSVDDRVCVNMGSTQMKLFCDD